jgi:hypothetical protein
MIKLTITSPTYPQAKIVSFDQPNVIIGAEAADLSLSEEGIQKKHITIIEEEQRFIVINTANDPFATYNALPFGKKVLKNHDVIQVGNSKIVFEGEHQAPIDVDALFQELEAITALETKGLAGSQATVENEVTSDNINFHSTIQNNPQPLAGTIKEATQDNLNTTDAQAPLDLVTDTEDEILVDNALDDAEDLAGEASSDEAALPLATQENLEQPSGTDSQEIEVTASAPTSEPSHPETSPSVDEVPQETAENVLKNDPLAAEVAKKNVLDEDDSDTPNTERERNEDSENHLEKEPHESEVLALASQSNWRLYLALFIAFSTLMSLVGTVMYFKVVHASNRERIEAAEAVADVSMALAYAQVHNIKPQKQNWSDPDFLKNNLASVLSSEYPAFSHIDKQGQLENCAYILRIYTSSDLAHFLVIAQPEPTLLQRLIPKAAIIVDSRAMEMRHINDLKALNRLLVNPNTLDGANAVEISNIVKEGDLIPLSSLATNQQNHGFIPPKLLALSHPGAENLIYNAPRYYHFGESVINRAVHSLEGTHDEHEASRLKEQIEALANYTDIVLYSSQGIQKAIKAQKALAAYAPHSKFITGYLNFNTQGEMTGSHLVYNDNQALVYGPQAQTGTEPTAAPFHDEDDLAVGDHAFTGAPHVKTDTSHVQTDLNHSLLLRLTSLANDRRQSLTSISDEINALLGNNNTRSIDDFKTLLSELIGRYEKTDLKYQKKIIKELIQLYEEYPELSLTQFIAYLNMAGLDQYYKPTQ